MFNQNLRQQDAFFGKIKNAFRILALAICSVVLLGSVAPAQSTTGTSALEAGWGRFRRSRVSVLRVRSLAHLGSAVRGRRSRRQISPQRSRLILP